MSRAAQNRSAPCRSTLQLCAAVALCALALLLPASTGWSLSNDREQDLIWSADGDTVINTVDGTRVVTVNRNVFIKQGSMELRGDQAIFEYDQRNSELRKVTVNGAPASFQQQPDGSSNVITGSSEVIHYYTGAQNQIEFIGAARFNQEGSVMNCVEIRHIIGAGTTEMTGPCSGTLPPQTIE